MTSSGSTFMRILNPTVDSGETSMVWDVVGLMKLLNWQLLIHRPVLDYVEIANTRPVLFHLQTKETCYEAVSLGPGSNSILQIHGQCRHFRYPFSDDTEFRTYSWTLALSSISSSHVFIDKDSNPQSTTSIVRLNSNLEFAKKVNA